MSSPKSGYFYFWVKAWRCLKTCFLFSNNFYPKHFRFICTHWLTEGPLRNPSPLYQVSAANKLKIIDEIVALLKQGKKRGEILSKVVKKWQISTRTFDRHFKE